MNIIIERRGDSETGAMRGDIKILVVPNYILIHFKTVGILIDINSAVGRRGD